MYLYLYPNNCIYTYSPDVSLRECKNIWVNEVSQEVFDNLLDAEDNPNYIYENETVRLLTQEEKKRLYPTPPQTQLDRIEAAILKSKEEIIDEYTLQLVQEGVIE